MKNRTAAALVVLACVCLAHLGCEQIKGAADTTVGYVRGELRTTVAAKLPQTWKAAEAAVKELKLKTISSRGDALVAQVVARNVTDDKIEISIKSVSKALTEIRIRVGAFGDEAFSRQVLGEIKKRL